MVLSQNNFVNRSILLCKKKLKLDEPLLIHEIIGDAAGCHKI